MNDLLDGAPPLDGRSSADTDPGTEPDTATRPLLGAFAAAVAFLLPVVVSTSTSSTSWAPKNALLPVVAAVGLPQLVVLLRERQRSRPPAVAAAVFLALCLASTLLAGATTTTVFGVYGVGTGVVFVASCVGAWAIGARLDHLDRRRVEGALLAGVVVNGVVAVATTAFDLSAYELGLFEGRAMGLQGNPIHLGAIAVAGLALVAARLERRLVGPLAVAALLAATIQLSGSRSAALAGFGVLACCAARLGRARVAALLVAIVLGAGGGALLATATDGVSVSARVGDPAAASGGIVGRVENWWSATGAIEDRPLLGSGPGSYRAATSAHRPPSLARAFGADAYYGDAHNLFVEYAVTTGLLGVVAFGAWTFLAVRSSAGSLLIAALGVLVVGLVEPQWAGTTPVALLALGAAGRGAPGRTPRAARSATLVLAPLGLLLGACLLVGEFHLDQARLDFRREPADAALRLLPAWPEPAVIRSRIETFEGRTERDREKVLAGIEWLEVAVARDPTNPSTLLGLADAQASAGLDSDARESYERMIRANPTSTRACNALALLARRHGDDEAAAAWFERSLEIVPGQAAVEAALEDLRASAEPS